MQYRDIRGLAVSGANAKALPYYEQAVAELQCYRADPLASVDRALELAPGFAMAHVLRAWLHLLGTEPAGLPVARAAHGEAARHARSARERGHVAAIGHLLEGHWHRAARVLEDVGIDAPRDALALQAGHVLDFAVGHSRMLRDRIARALPAWNASVPGYHAVLGMHAFGLEEMADYARAEAAGRRAVELEQRDAWAWHAVAHVMEMQNRSSDGIAWLRSDTEAWAQDSFFKVHNWWHLAVFHYDRDELDAVLELFDGEVYGAASTQVLDMVDASALLWRLHLRGVPLGERWQVVADNWAPLALAGNYAFNDAHAVMSFVGAGRRQAAAAVLAMQHEIMVRSDDNAVFVREVGHPLCRALLAFGDGDYHAVVELLRPIRSIAHRFGGSHAQRDLIDLTLIEAALRAGESALAAALAAERVDLRPASPLAHLLARRSESMPLAA
jgi:tetratricopeptide (TPR) repeat protein